MDRFSLILPRVCRAAPLQHYKRLVIFLVFISSAVGENSRVIHSGFHHLQVGSIRRLKGHPIAGFHAGSPEASRNFR
jgi:hypothetical protein